MAVLWKKLRVGDRAELEQICLAFPHYCTHTKTSNQLPGIQSEKSKNFGLDSFSCISVSNSMKTSAPLVIPKSPGPSKVLG